MGLHGFLSRGGKLRGSAGNGSERSGPGQAEGQGGRPRESPDLCDISALIVGRLLRDGPNQTCCAGRQPSCERVPSGCLLFES